MDAIEIVPATAIEWTAARGGEFVAPHHDGDPRRPQCFEIRCPPNYKGRLHAHDADEVIFVLEGALFLNGQHLDPGSSIAIPSKVFYALDAGPAGVRYVNFRPFRDHSIYAGAPSGDATPGSD